MLPAAVRRRRPTKGSSSARLDRNEATSDWIATVDSPALPARPMSVSPMMRRSTSGRIRLDISSRSFVVAAASRAGVEAMSRSAAREIAIELATCGTRESINSSRSSTWRKA
jgi:hypothetical protein